MLYVYIKTWCLSHQSVNKFFNRLSEVFCQLAGSGSRKGPNGSRHAYIGFYFEKSDNYDCRISHGKIFSLLHRGFDEKI